MRTTALDKYPDLYLVWLHLDVSCKHLTLYMHNLSPDLFPFLCPRAHWTAPPSKSWPCPKPGCPPSFFSFVHSFNQRVLMLLPSRYCFIHFFSSNLCQNISFLPSCLTPLWSFLHSSARGKCPSFIWELFVKTWVHHSTSHHHHSTCAVLQSFSAGLTPPSRPFAPASLST